MTQAHWSDFLTTLPIGYFRLDQAGKVIYANQAWLDLFGYPSLDDLPGQMMSHTYAHEDGAEKVQAAIDANGAIHDLVVEMKRLDGVYFWASIYASNIIAQGGASNKDNQEGVAKNGCEGILIDVTERQIQRRIEDTLPAGYYEVEIQNGREHITFCNQEFAEMFGFASAGDAAGFEINQLYRNPTDYEEFWQRLAHGQENGVRNREIEVKSLDGRHFLVETNINVTRNEQGQPIRRVCVVRDLSKDEPLQRLRNDLGNVLHTYTTGLIAIKSDMETAKAALGVDPFAKVAQLTNDLVLSEMTAPLGRLQRSTQRLVEALAGREGNVRKPFEERVEQLQHVPEILSAFRAQAMRDMAHGLLADCQTAFVQGNMPREPLKNVREDAHDLMRIFALARLKERISDVLQMEHELRSLRAFVTGPSQPVQTPQTRFSLWSVVEQSMSNLHDFAESRGVGFRPLSHANHAMIFASDRDILRVVTNVLHNAIKYSWSRDSGIWIDIYLTRHGNQLRLEIINYGVPIPADELKSGLIFSFGYRSRISADRGRVGTGIGLADARQTLKRYKGSIELDSRTASPGGEADGMDPFLTTAIITMPLTE